MAISSAQISVRKTSHTAQQPQPDDANPNTAESMVKNAHRTTLDQVDPGGWSQQQARLQSIQQRVAEFKVS
jgi:hypothetical protein